MTIALAVCGAAVGSGLALWLRRRPYLDDGASRPIGWWAVAVAAVVTSGVFGLLSWRIDELQLLVVGGLFAAGGVVAAWTDLDAHLLLDKLTYPLAGILLVTITVSAASTGWWERWVAALLSAGAVAGVLLVWAVFGSLGLGDVKLGVSVGLVLGFAGGWPMTVRGVLLSLLIAAVLAAALLVAGRSRKSHLPLGPALVAGVVACLLG